MASKARGKSAVTIYEIAEHVGMSPAAVSSVLANRHVERRIAPNSVRRIREAAQALGYVPNMAGRRLRARDVNTRQFDLGILTSFEAPLPLVGQVLRTLQRAVDAETTRETRYAVAIEMFHAGRLREKPGLLDANRYHGLILTNTLPDDDAFLAGNRLQLPVVMLGRRIPGYDCVLEAPAVVGRHAAELLLAAGCRHPGILHARSLTVTTRDRLEAFVRTVAARSGREPVMLASDGLLPVHGAAIVEEHFNRDQNIDGLFAVTDSLALGAFRAIKRSGRQIPGDVAVVGVGDNELAEFFAPSLTTVAGGNEAMAAEAVPLLFRMLRGAQEASGEVLVVPPVFERESTRRSPVRSGLSPAIKADGILRC